MRLNKLGLATGVSILGVLSGSQTSAGEIELSSGIEYFSWREYISSCPETLEERGPRVFIGLEQTNSSYQGWDLGIKGRGYAGLVYYDGFDITCAPLAATTSYFGLSAEAGAIRWLSNESAENSIPRIGLKMGLGFDTWRRSILASGGYSEDYFIGFGRIGLAAAKGENWSAEVGAKYPFSTNEVAYLTGVGYSADARLNPKAEYSFFASVKFVPASGPYTWLFYYDSYRFKESNSVPISGCPVNPCSVYQPTSHQDTFGVSLTFKH